MKNRIDILDNRIERLKLIKKRLLAERRIAILTQRAKALKTGKGGRQ